MHEGLLGVDKEHVRHPDLFHQAAIESHAVIGVASEGQAFVFPVVSQIQGHCKVLTKKKQTNKSVFYHYKLTCSSCTTSQFGADLPYPPLKSHPDFQPARLRRLELQVLEQSCEKGIQRRCINMKFTVNKYANHMLTCGGG